MSSLKLLANYYRHLKLGLLRAFQLATEVNSLTLAHLDYTSYLVPTVFPAKTANSATSDAFFHNF